MNPLQEHIEKQIAERLTAHKIVVLYDPRAEFQPFFKQLEPADGDAVLADAGEGAEHVVKVRIGGVDAWVAEYDGSFFELRAAVERFTCGAEPDYVLVYLPGCKPDARASVLRELEDAGESYEPSLMQLARIVLRRRHTAGVIDGLTERPNVTYEDLFRACAEEGSREPSALRGVFGGSHASDAILAAWLASEAHDAAIEQKGAVDELVKLVRSRLGPALELPDGAGLSKLRAITLRYVLVGELRADLRCAPPPSLQAIPVPESKPGEEALRELARRLRGSHADAYATLADRIEAELGLASAALPKDALGSIDTFRFEERALLGYCSELIADGRYDEATVLVNEREHSFWLDRDLTRKAHWQACRRMAELGSTCKRVREALASTAGSDAQRWLDAYTAKDGGWYALDQAQRRLETWVAKLGDDADERALGLVRRAYEDTCTAMAEGFTKALGKAGWTLPGALHQTHVWSDVVTARPRPVAYFVIDAMRYEMGVELAERLPHTAELSLRPAVCALPSITPIGMAALLPGASASFDVVEHKGKLGASIDGTFMADLPARKKLAASRVPNLVDLSLDELLSLPKGKLDKKLEGAQVVLVRSQEIDHAGEAGFERQARRVMDEVIGDIAQAIQRLSRAGIEHAVVSADHGHLFAAGDRDESMRADAPGGAQVDLHRRCWIGRGGTAPPGCVRVPASALGYTSDLDFVVPVGAFVFRAGGDLAFHHGGPSLQELVIPVLAVRLKLRESVRPQAAAVQVAEAPPEVTNVFFSVMLQLGSDNLALFASTLRVRPMLVAEGRQVGVAGMAIPGEVDRAGCVVLEPGKPVKVAFKLGDDRVSSLRIVIQDPATDAELYRSPKDIAVRLLR